MGTRLRLEYVAEEHQFPTTHPTPQLAFWDQNAVPWYKVKLLAPYQPHTEPPDLEARGYIQEWLFA